MLPTRRGRLSGRFSRRSANDGAGSTASFTAAGVIADKALAEKTSEQFAAVFATKVRGFASLLEAAKNDDLRFIYVFHFDGASAMATPARRIMPWRMRPSAKWHSMKLRGARIASFAL